MKIGDKIRSYGIEYLLSSYGGREFYLKKFYARMFSEMIIDTVPICIVVIGRRLWQL
jgi:hypothetical protein